MLTSPVPRDHRSRCVGDLTVATLMGGLGQLRGLPKRGPVIDLTVDVGLTR